MRKDKLQKKLKTTQLKILQKLKMEVKTSMARKPKKKRMKLNMKSSSIKRV
jgi:hypothetical protein